MKKILYSVFALAMAAFTLTSCEDVPAPYNDPNQNEDTKPVLPEGVLLDQSFTSSLGEFSTVSASGELSWYNDYSSAMVTGFQDFDGDGQKENKAGVTYLVGPEIDLTGVESAYISINHALNFEKGDINKNNSILISKNYSGNVLTATWEQLNYNTDGLNKDFTFMEKSVNIPAAYMGGKVVIALRHTCELSFSSTWEVKSIKVKEGKVEETPDTPDKPENPGVAEGDGTLEKPFNCVAANQYASSLAADQVSDKDIYIKGKVVSIKENFTTNFGYATFYISDDGTNANQFYVFRTLYLNNEKYVSGDLLQVGDDVVICGKVTNYYGNTPETVANQSYLYSLKSNGGGGSGDTGDLTAPNGDFEAWVGGMPNNWKTMSTAGNAMLSQSTDAHGGKYSVMVGGDAKANKRLGYKEMELKAGDYTMTFYAKAATSNGASVRPGYVQVTDGKVGSYMYGDYVNNISNTEWVLVTHTFNLPADGTYCIVVMNSKNPGGDVLIDDFKLTIGSNEIIK